MDDNLVRRIVDQAKYQELKAKRTRFGWALTLLMLIVCYGFVLLVAFNKPFLSQRLGGAVMTLGMPIGLGVIVFTIAITAYYVNRANAELPRASSEAPGWRCTVEESIASHPNVAEVAVIGVADALKGQVAMAIAVLRSIEALMAAN